MSPFFCHPLACLPIPRFRALLPGNGCLRLQSMAWMLARLTAVAIGFIIPVLPDVICSALGHVRLPVTMTASASISQWPCDQCNAGLPRLNSDDACPGRGCRLQLASSHFRCSECRLESNKIQLDRARGERSEFVEVWYCCRCDKGAFLVDERVKCAICSTQRCAGCNAIETEIWPSAINSPTVPRSNSDAFHAQRGDYRVRYHVRPFRPFIDKATDSSTLERRAPREPHPIDCAILKGWLDTCRQMHGGHCEPSSDYTRRPNWLVDATLKCVVAAGRLPYACLSYVWGNSSGDQLELANLPELRIPNSLASRSIPATVRDAFLIVEKLGLRYLWVDRLCIVQDVTGPKQQQISAMADIYANAEITIIAAQGHDSSVNLLPKEWIQPSNGEAGTIHVRSSGDVKLTVCRIHFSRQHYARNVYLCSPNEMALSRLDMARILLLSPSSIFPREYCKLGLSLRVMA